MVISQSIWRSASPGTVAQLDNRGSACHGDGARSGSCIGVWFRETVGSDLVEGAGRGVDALKSFLPRGAGEVPENRFGDKDCALTWRQKISPGAQDSRSHHEGLTVEVRAKRVEHPSMHG